MRRRAVEMGYFHTVFYGADQFLRYYPVIYGLGYLAGAVGTPALAPAAYILLVNMSWALLEWSTEDYVQSHTTNTELHECINYSHTGYQKVYKDIFLTLGRKSGIKLNNKILKSTLSDRKWDNIELLASLVCAIALDVMGHGEMERLMSINETRKSYYKKHLPPIVIYTFYAGRSRPKHGKYGRDQVYRGVYHLNMDKLYTKGWSRSFDMENEIRSGVAGSVIFTKDSELWKKYSEDKLVHSHRPQRQLIRVNMSKDLINTRKNQVHRDDLRGADWWTVDLDKLGFVIRIQQGDGKSRFILIDEETRNIDIAKEQRSAVLSLNLGYLQIGSTPNYPKGFLGERMFQGVFQGQAYTVLKDFGSSLYKVDVGYYDGNNNYIPVSNSVTLDFSIADKSINKFETKEILLNSLGDNTPETFLSTHASIFGEPLPVYRWHIVNTEALQPKEMGKIFVTGRTKHRISPWSTEYSYNKAVSCTYNGITDNTTSKEDGSFSFVVPCDVDTIVIKGQGETHILTPNDCSPISLDLGEQVSVPIQVSTQDPDDLPPPPDDPEMDKMLKEQMEEMKKWGDEQRKKNKKK